MINKIKTLYGIIMDELILKSPDTSILIKDGLYNQFKRQSKSKFNFKNFLNLHPSVSNIELKKDWYYDKKVNEWNYTYHNNIFGTGKIRFFCPKNYKKIVIFFPGSVSSTNDIMSNKNSQFYLKETCKTKNLALITWEWPMQGNRLKNGLIKNFKRPFSLEKEYARILPIFGSSLWREYIEEIFFCFKILKKRIDKSVEIDLIGWSQGGWFSYFAPLCGLNIKQCFSAGSCAFIRHLLISGKTQIHGYFYYPLMKNNKFDLDDIIKKTISTGTKQFIVFGDHDRGCLLESKNTLEEKFTTNLEIKIFKNLSHRFGGKIKEYIISKL